MWIGRTPSYFSLRLNTFVILKLMNPSFEMSSSAPQGTSYLLRVESDVTAAGLFVSGERLTVSRRAANIRRCMYQKQPLLNLRPRFESEQSPPRKSRKQFQFTASIGIV